MSTSCLENMFLNYAKIMFLNIQGMVGKTDVVEAIAFENNLEIICIAEHWLDPNELKLVTPSTYILVSHFCRKIKHRGGSAIFIKNNLSFKELPDISKMALEEIFELSTCYVNELSTLFVCIYRNPINANRQIFLEHLDKLLNKISLQNVNTIITGDFNVDFNHDDVFLNELTNLIESYGMHVMIKGEITRPGLKKNGSCIDNVVTTLPQSKCSTKVSDVGISDHYAIFIDLEFDDFKSNYHPMVYKTMRSVSDYNMMLFNIRLSKINWFDVYSITDDAKHQFSLFFEKFSNIVDFCFPLNTIGVRHNKPKSSINKWYTADLRELKTEYDNYLLISKYTTNNEVKAKCKRLKYEYRSRIRQAKLSYNNALVAKAANKPRQIWKIINENSEMDKQFQNTDCSLSADGFNNFFIDSVQEVIDCIPNSTHDSNYYLVNAYSDVPKNVFSFQHVSVEEVYSAILSLSNSNCLDVYYTNSGMIKVSGFYVSETLAHIFNNCLDSAYFPCELKLTKVVPVHKKGGKNQYNNYRPISIVPTWSKVFERIISNQILKFLDSNNLLSNCQYGFRKKLSTCDAVLKFIQNCINGKENKFSVGAKFFDLSKAFDTVCHQTLLNKLQKIGFSKLAVNLIGSYLEHRTQTVFCRNRFSSFDNVNFGVPQGSILGPLLFILYINDLPNVITSDCTKCYLYADDICLCVSANPVNSDVNNLFRTNLLTDWCNANKLSINLAKTQNLDISYGSHNGDVVKFLGIVLQNNLSWQSHVSYISSKVAKGIFIIRKLQHTVSEEILISIYYGFIHSLLSYGTILWGNSSAASSLFVSQKRAVRLICKVAPRTHCKPLFTRLNIMTVPCLFIFQCLLYVKNNLSNFSLNSDVHSYNTRNCDNLRTDYCAYTKTLNSFNSISAKLYNKLPSKIKNLEMKCYKQKLRHYLIQNCFYSVNEFLNS